MQPRNGTITIPAEARRALRLDLPGAQVEVILRDHDLVLRPYLAVPLDRVRIRRSSCCTKDSARLRCGSSSRINWRRAPDCASWRIRDTGTVRRIGLPKTGQ